MRVQFQRLFFGPNGSRYRPGVEYDVPDSWKEQLPDSTKVLDEEKPKKAGTVEATAAAPAGSSAKGTKL